MVPGHGMNRDKCYGLSSSCSSVWYIIRFFRHRMQKLWPFYFFIMFLCKIGQISCFLILVTTRLLNIAISQRILIFEHFIIFFEFFYHWKRWSRGVESELFRNLPLVPFVQWTGTKDRSISPGWWHEPGLKRVGIIGPGPWHELGPMLRTFLVMLFSLIYYTFFSTSYAKVMAVLLFYKVFV